MTWCVPRCTLPADVGGFPRPPSSSAPPPVPASSFPAVWPASVWTDVCGSGNPGPHTYRWPGSKLDNSKRILYSLSAKGAMWIIG